MNRINYRISLDMFEVAAQTTIKAKKGDTACSIHITLTENGKIYNITDGCYAVFSAKKPDGNYIFNSDTCSIEDNAIVYDFTEQTVPCEGVVECEVILFKDEQRLTSPRFNLVVDSTVYNGEEIVSSVSIDVFDQMIEEVKDRATNEIVNESVSHSQEQKLTDEQKQMARENIGAFNADKVKSTLGDLDGLSDNVLTVSGIMELIERQALNPNLPNDYPISYKYQMLKHLEGTWELLYTIEGDGTTNTWEFTKFADGSDLKLRAAAVKTINTVAASADTYGFIYAYDSSSNVIGTAVITKFLSTAVGAVALGVIEQDKGYYRAYSVDGAKSNPGSVRYSGFQQYNEVSNIETTPYIPRIRVVNQSTAYLPVGSTIEVWGVKA